MLRAFQASWSGQESLLLLGMKYAYLTLISYPINHSVPCQVRSLIPLAIVITFDPAGDPAEFDI